MFQATRMLFLYVETPLHAGSGRSLGAVDLPIQRERATGYPMVQSSGLKGCLRAAAGELNGAKLTKDELFTIFGPETADASAYAGALAVGDARLLLFPVRSLAGVFAWTTSAHVLARFKREAALANLNVPWNVPPEPAQDAARVSGTSLKAGDSIVLEEFSFTPQLDSANLVGDIGKWLADHALPQTAEYEYWRRELPKRLCVLPEDVFRDFVMYATEVQTHVRLDPATKTVQTGALWTTESLPVDTLLYAPLLASDSRNKSKTMKANDILNKIANLGLARLQLGGDETTGQGMVSLQMAGGKQ